MFPNRPFGLWTNDERQKIIDQLYAIDPNLAATLGVLATIPYESVIYFYFANLLQLTVRVYGLLEAERNAARTQIATNLKIKDQLRATQELAAQRRQEIERLLNELQKSTSVPNTDQDKES